MKLSIITINYNNVEGLRKTIDSVLCQTWKDFEWIFIDGGSTDGSKELIEKTAAEYPNVSYWCSEPDNGVYNAQNKGISHAKGEYLNFMNSGDTFYDENVLLNVWRCEHTEDVLYGDWLWCGGEQETLSVCPKQLTIAWLYSENICHQAMFICTKLLKTEGFDERFTIYADWARWMKMVCNGNTFKYIAQIICRYESDGLSASNKQLIAKEKEMVHSLLDLPLQRAMNEYVQAKQKLNRYESFKFNDTALQMMEKRPFYRRTYRIITALIRRTDKFLSICGV